MEVILVPTARKQFDKIPKTERAKIKKKLQFLQQFPLEGKKLSGDLDETRSLRAWPYRIIYYIDSKRQTVFITNIGHRQGVYK